MAGVAIMMIGAFSGAYHICPTLNNYQYDTLFMFFLCGVSFAALYKRRHGAYFIRPVGFFLSFCLIFVVNTMGVWMKQNNLYVTVRIILSCPVLSCPVLSCPVVVSVRRRSLWVCVGGRAVC